MGNDESKMKMEALSKKVSSLQTNVEKKESEAKTLQAQLKSYEQEKDRVAKMKLEKPWRNFARNGGWTKEYRDWLIKYILSYEVPKKLEYTKLLLFGPVGVGKSSFISSIASVDKDRIAVAAIAGQAGKSLTRNLMQYIPKKQLAGQFRILDTMGVEEVDGQGFNVQDVIYLMEGNVPPDYEFNPGKPINPVTEKKFIKSPTLRDKPHCIAIIMESKVIDDDAVSDDAKKKLKLLQTYIRNHSVPIVILLTKLDTFFEDEHMDIKGIYHSRKMMEIVKKAEEMFGVPEMNIMPVQNYRKETDLDLNMDILLLLALKRMLDIATDRLEYLADQKA